MADNNAITLGSLKTILSAIEHKFGGNAAQPQVEPREDDIPVIYIHGEVPDDKDYKRGTLEYFSATDKFTAYINYKLQGASTMALPKKNYTILLSPDPSRTTEMYKSFKHWGERTKFVLKADYHDVTHTRNLISARLWGKIVSSRKDYNSLPSELRNTPNNGAADGFPVLVYLNNEYQGVYNLMIPKDRKMFGMNKKNENHVALVGAVNDQSTTQLQQNPCNFNAPWSSYSTAWEYEVGANAEESWDRLYNYIYANPNPTELEKYLDIQSAIDYYIFVRVILGIDSLARNVVLLTYDKIKWYISAYDLDNTFGTNMGNQIEPDYSGYFNTYSELWPFLTNNYANKIAERYKELRAGVLSYGAIVEEFEKYMRVCDEDICIKDVVAYPGVFDNAKWNTPMNLKNFIKERLKVVDIEILGGELNG